MSKNIFITATNTNIGKTYASTLLLENLGKRGVRVGACKPIETGVYNIPQDALKLVEICKKYNKNFKTLTPFDITAYTFPLPAAPFSADSYNTISISKIKDKIVQLSNLCDFLLIEGAGGLYVPIFKDYFMIDLIKELNYNTLLVTPSYLGCINETILSLKALESYNINFDWCVNLYQDIESFSSTTKPFYDKKFPNWQTLQEYIDKFTI